MNFVAHKWGYFVYEGWNWNVPWVTNRWFYPSPLLLMMWLTFLYSESENVLISPVDFKKTHQIAIVIGNLLAVHDWQSRTASIYASCTWLSITYSKRTMVYMLAVHDWQSRTPTAYTIVSKCNGLDGIYMWLNLCYVITYSDWKITTTGDISKFSLTV